MKKGPVVAFLLLIAMMAGGCVTENAGGKPAGLPEITEPYHPDAAERNGDIVLFGARLLNGEKWDGFMENLDNLRPDSLRITRYTVEGDPIFHEFVFDGERLQYTYDNTRDKFGFPRKETSYCKGFVQEEFYGSPAWFLDGCEVADMKETFYWPMLAVE